MKKKLFGLLACMLAMLMLLGCGAKPAEPAPEAEKPAAEEPAPEAEKPAEEPAPADGEKIKLTLMIEQATGTYDPRMLDMLKEKFPEVEFVSKSWDTNQCEKIFKTAYTGGDPIDISMYWPNQVMNFVSADMVLDMTPYLEADPEWKATFAGTSLESGNIDGKYYAVPFDTVYPMLQINKALVESAGVEIKDQWTWEEFMDACKKIEENTDAFPIACPAEWACWFNRNAMLQVWDNDEEVDAFAFGQTPFTDERVKAGYDKVAEVYNNNYVYPGESALTSTIDQATAAFVQGKAAIMCNVNAIASSTAASVGDAFEIQIASWPSMAPTPEQDHLLGGNDGYIVAANTKYPDLCMEIVKYLCSPEIMRLRVDLGAIPTVLGIESSDPNFDKYGQDADKVYPYEVINVSSEVMDYIFTGIPANYVMYGETALEELEELRLEAQEG